MRFVKMHGIGNDFVLVRDSELKNVDELGQLAREMCDRHFGIGADGLIVVGVDYEYDIYMRIFNADGSEAEMCGNGIRCAAKYAWDSKLISKNNIGVRTMAGPRYPEIILHDGKVAAVKVDMGEPILKPADIPADFTREPVVNEKITVSGKEFAITAVSMGNPHCVIFVDDANNTPVAEWGPQIEKHIAFPRRTNVEFVQVVGPCELIMRVWERGSGETLACGTGACATLVAAVLNGKSKRRATVHLAGGDLEIEWSEQNNHVYMTGPATEVFRGEYLLNRDYK